MRHIRIVIVIAAAAFLLTTGGGDVKATPGLGGTWVFSVSTIGPAHDITPAGCTSADILAAPGTGPGPCGARVPPAPPGPVPDGVSVAFVDLGLNLVFGPFSDDLEDFSFNEALFTGAVDFDFSVDAAPANGGVTVGAPFPPACAGFVPNVTTEAAALEAQGDMFTTGLGVPVGCNTQATDEGALGLIAPNAFAPAVPPLDDMDGLGEYAFPPGPCTLVGGIFFSGCAAYTVTAGSGLLPFVAPDAVTFAPATGGTILAQPGSPPAPPGLPGGCPAGGLPCGAVGFPILGLVPADDVDALCWFDVMPNGAPDVPVGTFGMGSPGDLYVFSLAPGSPSLGFFGLSAADLLTTTVPAGGPPVVVRTAASLGLLPSDDVDALICHDSDPDGDLIPDFLDNCDNWANSTLLLPPWPVPAGDPDCDGFTSANETTIGTLPLDSCGVGAWPPDFDDSMLIDITDVLTLKLPFGGMVPPYAARLDISPSGLIDISDVLSIKPFFGASCT